jgi:ureidoacrylate peracid hydrolase
VAGSPGHATVPELAGYVDAPVWKVAYSAFFNTQLDWVLRRADIDMVVVCGIVTNGGVASTARDAHMRDYRVLVLADGCAASTQTAHDAALADLRTVADVISCEAFAGRLAA